MPPGWPGGQCCGAGGSGLRAAGGGCAFGAAAASGGGAETSACAASTLAIRPPTPRVSALHVHLLARARRQPRSGGGAAAVRMRVRKQRGGRNAPGGLCGRSLCGSCVIRHMPTLRRERARDCAARSAPPAAVRGRAPPAGCYTLAPVPAACAALARCCERRHARAAGAVTRPAAACQRCRLGGCAINGRWRLRRRRRRARS